MPVLNQIAEGLITSTKPLIKQIYDRSGKKVLAIGLKRDVVLPEHMAPGKAKIFVIQGEIDLNTSTHSYRLERFDSFDIPENELHSVTGVYDAVFLLLIRQPTKP